jgi:hypothetical protein
MDSPTVRGIQQDKAITKEMVIKISTWKANRTENGINCSTGKGIGSPMATGTGDCTA